MADGRQQKADSRLKTRKSVPQLDVLIRGTGDDQRRVGGDVHGQHLIEPLRYV
jgi:hypothetical protein